MLAHCKEDHARSTSLKGLQAARRVSRAEACAANSRDIAFVKQVRHVDLHIQTTQRPVLAMEAIADIQVKDVVRLDPLVIGIGIGPAALILHAEITPDRASS